MNMIVDMNTAQAFADSSMHNREDLEALRLVLKENEEVKLSVEENFDFIEGTNLLKQVFDEST